MPEYNKMSDEEKAARLNHPAGSKAVAKSAIGSVAYCAHGSQTRLLGLDPRLWRCNDCKEVFLPGDASHPDTARRLRLGAKNV